MQVKENVQNYDCRQLPQENLWIHNFSQNCLAIITEEL